MDDLGVFLFYETSIYKHIYIYTLIYRKSGWWSSKPSTVCSARLKPPLHKNPVKCTTGWWFGTCFIFPYIGNFIIPTDEIIQRGRSTTNQTKEAWMIEDGWPSVAPGDQLPPPKNGLGWPSSIRRHFRRKPYCRYPLAIFNSLLLKMTIYSGFSHWKWWFSIVMLVYQRVRYFYKVKLQVSLYSHENSTLLYR